MQLSLEPNSAQNRDSMPYFVRIENQSATIDLSQILHVPVKTTEIDDILFYESEACGFQIRTQTLDQIVPLVGRLIERLTFANRLPTYVFISRYTRNIHLVYTIEHEVVVFVSGGPSFRHVELAKVRQYLGDYLRDVGLLGPPNRPDKLHVRGIHRKTLSLIRPIFYFKKWVDDEGASFWAPVFLSNEDNHIFTFTPGPTLDPSADFEEEDHIFTFAASAKRATPLENGLEVFKLHDLVTRALIADKRLEDPFDLQPDRLFPKQWDQLQTHLQPSAKTVHLSNKELPIYAKEDLVVAVDHRLRGPGPIEDRYSLFLGRDLAELQRRVAVSTKRR